MICTSRVRQAFCMAFFSQLISEKTHNMAVSSDDMRTLLVLTSKCTNPLLCNYSSPFAIFCSYLRTLFSPSGSARNSVVFIILFKEVGGFEIIYNFKFNFFTSITLCSGSILGCFNTGQIKSSIFQERAFVTILTAMAFFPVLQRTKHFQSPPHPSSIIYVNFFFQILLCLKLCVVAKMGIT